MFGITKIFYNRETGGEALKERLKGLSSYLELLVQFPLDPVGHVSQSDLPLPQLGAGLQLQVRRRPEAVPAAERLVRPHPFDLCTQDFREQKAAT